MSNSNKKGKIKRLSPTKDVLRQLYLKSGNECAFPSCKKRMMSSDGVFVGQICHIEAAENGGQRFNENQSNEERRGFSNLLLMCYEHHVTTNNTDIYTVTKMKEIKERHECKFVNLITDMHKSYENNEKNTLPVLVFKKVDSGTQKWTRNYSIKIRQSTPALNTFEFECTSGESARSEIKNYNDIFISIDPINFKKGDKIYITAYTDKYDEVFLMSSQADPLKIECITKEGDIKIIELNFQGYDCRQNYK